MGNKKYGFTLVELIVVITILAILSTIAFLSLQGFSVDSRDATRISDIKNFRKGIELYAAQKEEYPMPDNANSVVNGADKITYEGEISDLAAKNARISTLKDPLSGENYAYSLSGDKNEYEVMYILEGDLVSSIFKTANANTYTTKIDGNYNGFFAVSKNGNYVSMPSLFANVSGNNVTVDLATDSLNFKISGKVSDVAFVPRTVNQTSTTSFITDLQSHYTGNTELYTIEKIKEVVDVSLSDTTKVAELYSQITQKPLKYPFSTGTRLAMESCPTGWAEVGNLVTIDGRDTFLIENSNSSATFKSCEKISGDIPSGTRLAMESCPIGWDEVGNLVTISGRDTFIMKNTNSSATFKSCEKISGDIPPGTKVAMESCPTGWTDIGNLANIIGTYIFTVQNSNTSAALKSCQKD